RPRGYRLDRPRIHARRERFRDEAGELAAAELPDAFRDAQLRAGAPGPQRHGGRSSDVRDGRVMAPPRRSPAAQLRSTLSRFGRDERATTVVTFCLALPVVLGAVGMGLDYAMAAQIRGKMQAIADASALYAAREFQMVQANVDKVSAVARNYASQIQ